MTCEYAACGLTFSIFVQHISEPRLSNARFCVLARAARKMATDNTKKEPGVFPGKARQRE